MKKLLLLAAVAAMAVNASAADQYKLTEVWKITDNLPSITNDARQGFGMDGKYYINVKTADATQVVVYDENGLTETTFEGGTNCGITRDEAGNIVLSTATFPSAWSTESPMLRVINPTTGESKEYYIPADALPAGRCDFLGFPKGDLMDEGEIYLVSDKDETNICRVAISGGEVDMDNSYRANCENVTPITSSTLNYYVDSNGEEAVLYVTRNAWPVKMAFDGDNFTGTAFTLPNKGACNGMFPMVWDGKEYFIYPTLANYLDGWAVAEANAEEAIAVHEATATVNANVFQCDWLNAEVGEDGVTIYQYYPGAYIACYKLTKEAHEGCGPGDVDHSGDLAINDVTILIDRVLANAPIDGCCDTCADVDGDGDIAINDVTALIDLVLAGGN